MASALSNAYLNILDAARKLDPDGNIASMVDLLSKKNAFLQDVPFRAGNLQTGHKFSARVALPSPTWRRLNQGIAASKSQADTITETCGFLEGLSKIDVDLANLGGNPMGVRADEDSSFFSSFGIEVARAMFYESTNVNPERIQGLSTRFDGTGSAAAQLIRAEAAASVAATQTINSVWLVGWADNTVYGIFPKYSKAGFRSEDLGKQLVKDANNLEYLAYVTHHKWDVGLAVQDFRYVARIANIDPARWLPDASTGPDIPSAMQDAISAIYSLEDCDPVFYMNRATFSMFNKQLMKKSTNFLEYIERGGRRVPHFLGFPIRIADALVGEFKI